MVSNKANHLPNAFVSHTHISSLLINGFLSYPEMSHSVICKVIRPNHLTPVQEFVGNQMEQLKLWPLSQIPPPQVTRRMIRAILTCLNFCQLSKQPYIINLCIMQPEDLMALDLSVPRNHQERLSRHESYSCSGSKACH